MQYQVPAKQSFYSVIVDWNNCLQTYHAIVIDKREDQEHEKVLEIGVTPRELLFYGDLANRIKDYADLSMDVVTKMLKEKYDFGITINQ